jgi:hypothetical protein
MAPLSKVRASKETNAKWFKRRLARIGDLSAYLMRIQLPQIAQSSLSSARVLTPENLEHLRYPRLTAPNLRLPYHFLGERGSGRDNDQGQNGHRNFVTTERPAEMARLAIHKMTSKTMLKTTHMRR